MLDPNQEIYIGVFPHVRKAKSPLSRVRQRRFFDKAVGRLFFSLFLGTALVADALSHSRCDREHVNQIGEMLKAALLETEGMYLETGDGE